MDGRRALLTAARAFLQLRPGPAAGNVGSGGGTRGLASIIAMECAFLATTSP